jgi:hypothetical protein
MHDNHYEEGSSGCLSPEGLTSQCFEMNLTAKKTACAIARVRVLRYSIGATHVGKSYFPSRPLFAASMAPRESLLASTQALLIPCCGHTSSPQLFKGTLVIDKSIPPAFLSSVYSRREYIHFSRK